jgi:ABC-type bacteriocin/lantibiotic exporter with double-glycine peptidase domain
MTNNQIIHILREAALALRHDFDPAELRSVDTNKRDYYPGDFAELKRDIIEAGSKINLLILDYTIPRDGFADFLDESTEPVLIFRKEHDGLVPVLVQKNKRALQSLSNPTGKAFNIHDSWLTDGQDAVTCLVIMPYKSIVSDYRSEDDNLEKMSPMKRLLRLLATEKKEIGYILMYAVIIGLISLMLPIGLQSTVELISGGVFFSSVYILIGLVIIGVMVTGGLQIVQISLVEHLQRRIFTKAAFEFAFRIPRIRMESLMNSYAPELVNRFFEIISIQKGLPKLLIDLSAGAIQIFFGLVLLSLYHPFFVFFSILLVLILVSIFYLTGPRGLNSSLNESKYKYKVVQWLEELARTINSFKLAGNTDLPVKKADYAVNNYLKYRKTHFSVLITQYSFFVFFKVAVTGGLLIMGTILVIDREITLGQFVASEVIIVLVLNAMEKMIMYTDVVYDLLTAVDKVSHVTDLPIERSGGFDFPKRDFGKGYHIALDNIRYSYKGSPTPVLSNVNFNIKSQERICMAGPGGSGKTTLTNIIAGLYTGYEGGVSINNISLRDLDIAHLRNKVAKNISQEDIFDGTIYENVTVGKSTASVEDVVDVLRQVGLSEIINAMPEGLNTHILSGGKGLPGSVVHKLILARCLTKKPELIILNDFFSGLSKADKLHLMRCVINPESTWTLLAVSNDPLVMAACDRVIIMDGGKVVADDSYSSLLKKGIINQYFE